MIANTGIQIFFNFYPLSKHYQIMYSPFSGESTVTAGPSGLLP